MTTPSRRSLFALAILALALTVGAVTAWPSCARHEGDDGPAAVDLDLMAFLSAARALHHEANLQEEDGQLPKAIDAMNRLVALKTPHPERRTPEVEEVLADAYARLAELQLKVGDLDAAAAAVQKGLSHVDGVTYFKGHLIEVQGLIEGARAARFADAGNPAEAAKAREKAIELLEEVVKIQDQVIRSSLGKDAGNGATKQ
jgi:tetratricopeptide (TPR) repeat protein